MSAVGLAAQYLADGWTNAAVLDGGIDAWEKAGYPVVEKGA